MNAISDQLTMTRRFKLRVDDFLILEEAGVFQDCAKSELIEGEIFTMNAQWSRHSRAKSELLYEIMTFCRESNLGLNIMSEVSTHLSEHSLPEPDLVVSSYTGIKFVELATVRLIVEVSDTTLTFDLGRKKRLYARSAVPEYWVVAVEKGEIHQMWQPEGEDFRHQRVIKFGSDVQSETIAGLNVATGRL